MGRAACLAVCALVLVAATAAADITVQATVDRNSVAVGDPFVLSIDISGTQNAPAPDLGDLGSFQAQYLGPSTQVTIVNGQMSAHVSHRYQMVARKAGSFELGPFELAADGATYRTDAVRMQVAAALPKPAAGAAGAPGKEELSLVLNLGKTQAWVGERVPFEVKLYVGNMQVDNLQFPKISDEGVLVDKLPQPTRRDEVVNGRRFQSLSFPTVLTPLRPGPLEVTASMGLNLIVSRRRGGGNDPFFDQFFGGAERRPTEVHAESRQLTVLPLPEAGKPPDFSGAVGHFDLAVSAQPQALAAGDPITVRVVISGDGNLSSVAPPHIPVDDRFRAYDPQPAKDAEDGTRVFEQVLIPKQAGIAELPAVRFSFFDTEAGAYRTITRGPFPLTVTAGAASAAPQVVGPGAVAAPPEPVPEQLGRDIVYIKDAPGAFRPRGAAFFRGLWFWALQLVPVAAFAALSAFVRRRARLAADPRLVRLRQAGREARRALDGLAPSDGAAFYDQLTAAVHAYLGVKLDLPPGAVERGRVLERLQRNGSGGEVQQHVEAFFDLVEQMRYAPAASGASQRETALRLARGIVDALERQRGRGVRAAALLFAALLAAAPLAAQPVASDTGRAEPHTAFFQGNAAYQAGHYEEAARAYESVLGAGVDNGALYFNLGNAYFKGGHVGAAIVNYERARRLLPRDPDVRVNLAYAREQAHEEAAEVPLWQRLAFPLAGRATTAELAIVSALLWWALWGLAAALLLLPRLRPTLSRAVWIGALLGAFVAVNFAWRLQQFEWTNTAVVTAAGSTPVRFEPTASGTEHFQAGEGTVLDVTEERPDWLQVRRADGRRGWIPRQAVELVNGVEESATATGVGDILQTR